VLRGSGSKFIYFATFAVALTVMVSTAQAQKRVALAIGQNAYSGGASATIGLPPLGNPVRDARRMAQLLAKHRFEVISCDGKTPGCFDLDRSRLLDVLTQLEQRAARADLALVFFAGHGTATEEGNILTPVDAKVNCATGAITQGVPVERFMAATERAHNRLVILDACRDNPLGQVCPNLKDKKLSFTRIEPGAMQDFLLVTSTQFGQQALDGLAGAHSPFATALFSALETNPDIYFEQVMNEVARATYEAAQKQGGFLQIPGKVVGGAAPADCLAGKGCVGDARMAALAAENERLAADAAGVHNILEQEERTRGKPYTAEERKKRVAELETPLARMGTSTDPLRQEARRLIDQGNVADGQAKLDQALDADEKAIVEAERVAGEKRKAAAQSARDLAVLARGTDVVKALAYYQRATRLDPSDPGTWDAYARVALDAGRTAEARTAFEQAVVKAQGSSNPRVRYWATLGLGDVAVAQGDLPGARRLYETALAIAEPVANVDPGNAGWQRDLSVSQQKIGDVLRAQGNLPAALESFKASHAIFERLAKADPGNVGSQRDLSVSQQKIGDVLRAQGNLTAALESFKASLSIRERLAKADPGNAGWQHDVASSLQRVGFVAAQQGDRASARSAYQRGHEIMERLIALAPDDAEIKRDFAWFEARLAELEK
jgi:tetratricopeptide (TPR) repeat protein